MNPVLVLINVGAGAVQKAGPDKFAQQVSEGLEARGLTARIELLEGADLSARVDQFVKSAKDAPDARQKTLIVGGGDGTVNAAAALIATSEIVLGVLPLGTLNHFAKDLRIPVTLDAALDVIAAGNVRTVDAGEVNGRIFVNNSSIGVYPFLVAQRTAEQRRRRIGKLAAIFPALLRTLRGASWHRVTITAEDGAEPPKRREIRTPCVFVGNNFYDLKALGRRTDLCAGKLCVYVVRRDSWWGLLSLPFKIALWAALQRTPQHDIELLNVLGLTIQSHRRRLRIAVDGEAVHESTPLVYRSRPKALRVLAPSPQMSVHR